MILFQGGFEKAYLRSKPAVQQLLKDRKLRKFPDLCDIPGKYKYSVSAQTHSACALVSCDFLLL